MKIENGTTKATRGAHYLCCAIMILALGGASGCSTAVLAGCGVGIASGAALGGIAAASAPRNSVDVGTVMLGGSIFGLVSGCSAAAVANAVATSKAKAAAAEAESADPPASAPAPAPARIAPPAGPTERN